MEDGADVLENTDASACQEMAAVEVHLHRESVAEQGIGAETPQCCGMILLANVGMVCLSVGVECGIFKHSNRKSSLPSRAVFVQLEVVGCASCWRHPLEGVVVTSLSPMCCTHIRSEELASEACLKITMLSLMFL